MAISDQILKRTVIAAARTTFLLVGIASTSFLVASIAIPYSANLLSASLPRIKTMTFAYLSPSYLFITVHFIIIMIWKLHDHPPLQNEQPFDISQVAIPPWTLTSPPDPPPIEKAEIDDSRDDMDATWKAILEGGRRRERVFRKSKTFRGVSVGKEELSRRADAFIRTNYEQRRIQRQESEQRYVEMVNAAC